MEQPHVDGLVMSPEGPALLPYSVWHPEPRRLSLPWNRCWEWGRLKLQVQELWESAPFPVFKHLKETGNGLS